jgi:D-serine deaminase-like pyridoxal phosphate-dependent protein
MTAMNSILNELKEELKGKYVDRTLLEIPTPAALLDLSKIRRNCVRMLEVVDTLDFGWRAHIKTHKVPHRFILSKSKSL